MHESAVNRLVGSPPGYIDSQRGGDLTEAVKKRPYSVILFDEIEKASPKVFDLFLQIMDDGRLTSGRGETVRFSECLILMTSNLPLDEVPHYFRPEFLNRLDRQVAFQELTAAQLGQVMDILIAEESDLLFDTRGLRLDVTAPARNWLLSQNQHPEWGGRPLKRLISWYVSGPVSRILLENNPPPDQTIRVRLKGGQLQFDFIPHEAAAA
jgi:ATP-dependent Clp protease ATP-binding subunit ClpA